MVKDFNLTRLKLAIGVVAMMSVVAVAGVPFEVGEELEFEMGWKAAVAGTTRIKIVEKKARSGRAALHATLETTTNKAIDLVYPVRNRFESWIDEQAVCSLGFARRIREGDSIVDEDIFIDPVKGTYKSRKMRAKKDTAAKLTHGQVPAFVQDVVSTIYYLRSRPLAVGKSVPVQIFYGGEVYDATFNVLRKESIEVPAGRFRCVVVEPLFRGPKGFASHPKATLLIWMSDDAKRLPVKITAQPAFGQVEATLVRYRDRA